MALCRCGASHNKPLCDGRHEEAGFSDPGEVQLRPAEEPPGKAGRLTVQLAANGPIILRGVHRLVGATDETGTLQEKAALCRCGGSYAKPFCDGTHTEIEFQAP